MEVTRGNSNVHSKTRDDDDDDDDNGYHDARLPDWVPVPECVSVGSKTPKTRTDIN